MGRIRTVGVTLLMIAAAWTAWAQDEEMVILTGANTRPTWDSVHRISEAHRLSRGEGVRVGILDHSFGMDEHAQLYVDGRAFAPGRWGESLGSHSHHGFWMARALREVAPEAEIVALATAHREPEVQVAAMVEAIDWAVANGVDVLSYSSRAFPQELRPQLDAAVDRALAAGVVVVFIHYPHPGNLLPSSIGPRSGDDEREPDLNVLAADYNVLFLDRWRKLQSGEDTSYRPFLSMSSTAPVTAGAVALLRSLDPELTPAACRRVLQETARPMTVEGRRGERVLDAAAAVERVVAEADLGGLLQQAGAALRGQRPEEARELLRRVTRLAPAAPSLLLHAAGTELAAGDAERAAALVERAVRLGTPVDLCGRAALAGLASRPEWPGLCERAAANRAGPAPVDRLALGDPQLYPEGIAHDPDGGRTFLGSLTQRRIVQVAPDGTVATFADGGAEGLLQVVGLEVDAARGLLWAATAAGDRPPAGFAPDELGVSELVALDLATGAVKRRVRLDERPRRHFLNDLEIAADGTAYVTDSDGGAVWRLAPDAAQLVLLVRAPSWAYPNGIALAPDGRQLYVAHLAGVAVVDVRDGSWRPLAAPEGVTLAGIDGLTAHAGDLLAVQNGAGLDRLVRVVLAPGGAEVERLEILGGAQPPGRLATTGAVVEGEWWVSTTDGWDEWPPDEPAAAPEVLRIRLAP